jgi:hypothetical protein
MHIFPYKYDPMLEFYYNNNQRFIQKKIDPSVIKKSKIFEKQEIRWICIDNLKKMRHQFRSYFQNIVDNILTEQKSIYQFIKKSQQQQQQKLSKTRKNN